jgi:hypothetical protein
LKGNSNVLIRLFERVTEIQRSEFGSLDSFVEELESAYTNAIIAGLQIHPSIPYLRLLKHAEDELPVFVHSKKIILNTEKINNLSDGEFVSLCAQTRDMAQTHIAAAAGSKGSRGKENTGPRAKRHKPPRRKDHTEHVRSLLRNLPPNKDSKCGYCGRSRQPVTAYFAYI